MYCYQIKRLKIQTKNATWCLEKKTDIFGYVHLGGIEWKVSWRKSKDSEMKSTQLLSTCTYLHTYIHATTTTIRTRTRLRLKDGRLLLTDWQAVARKHANARTHANSVTYAHTRGGIHTHTQGHIHSCCIIQQCATWQQFLAKSTPLHCHPSTEPHMRQVLSTFLVCSFLILFIDAQR